MIVESDAHARELARAFLSGAGRAVALANDGAEALAQIETAAPDLVLTEIMIRKIDGLALCRRIKADPATRHGRVVVLSILAAVVRSQEAGADGFMKKPTIFVDQLVFHNAAGDRPILYFTTMSEPLPKMVRYLQQFPFFDEAKIGAQVVYEDIGPALASGGIDALVPRIQESVRSIGPKIIVIDSFKAIHDLSPSIPAMRRMLYELSGLLSAYEATTFLVGEHSEEHVASLPELAVADGIIQFSRKELGARDERGFTI